jgi:hypothetical protein
MISLVKVDVLKTGHCRKKTKRTFRVGRFFAHPTSKKIEFFKKINLCIAYVHRYIFCHLKSNILGKKISIITLAPDVIISYLQTKLTYIYVYQYWARALKAFCSKFQFPKIRGKFLPLNKWGPHDPDSSSRNRFYESTFRPKLFGRKITILEYLSKTFFQILKISI